jgi:hypothetical protein
MWITDLLNLTNVSGQLYVTSAAALVLGIYSFTIKCPPLKSTKERLVAVF